MKKWIQLKGTFLLSVFIATQAAWSIELEKVEEVTYGFPDNGNLILTANEGSISIKSWDREEVHLKMTKRAYGRSRREAQRLLEEIEVRIEEGKDRLVIREMEREERNQFNLFDLFDSDFWQEGRWRKGLVDFELTVPRKIQLSLDTDEGDVEVLGVEGILTVDVDEGDVLLGDIVSQKACVQVDEGDVRIERIGNGNQESLWTIDSDEGNIRVEDCKIGELDVNTDEGEIILRNAETSRFFLTTDEGDIRVHFQPAEGGNYRMETGEGDVEITISRNADLRIKLQTNEGRIESDFDLSILRRGDGELQEGVIGKERGILKAYTDEGDILLRE